MGKLFCKTPSTQAYLKMGLFGFAGSGKTWTASQTAIGIVQMLKERGLAEGANPVFFLDTETGSDYVKPQFEAAGIELQQSRTRAFADLVPAVIEAEAEQSVLIIDSISHFWREFMDAYKRKTNRRQIAFRDWDFLKGEWGKFTDRYVNAKAHIIMCGRAAHEYDFFEDSAGEKQLEKTGVKMRAETETGYEPSLLVLMERGMDMDTKQVTRYAYVLKERFGVIDGQRFANPKFADFRPHVELLNLGGDHLGVDTTRTSDDIIEGPNYESRDRAVVLDEIKELLMKHFPGQSAAEKKRKGDLLEKCAHTRSWEKLSTFTLDGLKAVYKLLQEATHAITEDAGKAGGRS